MLVKPLVEHEGMHWLQQHLVYTIPNLWEQGGISYSIICQAHWSKGDITGIKIEQKGNVLGGDQTLFHESVASVWNAHVLKMFL